MVSRKMFLLLMPVLLLLVAGCLPQPSLRSETLLHDDSLLTGEPCAAPCWENIIPGETTFTEAVEMLNAHPAVQELDTEVDEAQGLQMAIWKELDSDQPCCRLMAEGEDEPVEIIFLLLATPGMIVDDVLAQHGEPEYVVNFDFTDDESVVQLIYTEIPMVISVLVGDSTASLLANSEVVGLFYTTPEEIQLLVDSTELKAWAGYQSYQTYNAATPAVTPSVTLTPAE